MAKFGWAYIDCEDITPGSGSEGPPYSLQFVTESGGGTTGSALLSYYTAAYSDYDPSTVILSGSLIVTGAISASIYHINDIAIIDATGSTFFGDDQTDLHVRTGSMEIYKNSDSLVYKFDAVNTKLGVGTEPSAPVHIYKAAAASDHTPMELLRLEQQDEGVDMDAGHGPAITFYVGETGGSDHGGSVAVVREEAGDADSAAAMVFHTAGDDSAPTEKVRISSTGLVGIGATSPTHKLTVAGAVSGSTKGMFKTAVITEGYLHVSGSTILGDASGDSVVIKAQTIQLDNVAAGTDNTVLVYNGSSIVTDEIDSKVWAGSLIDATGTPANNQIATFTDSDTVQGESNLTFNGSALAIVGTVSGSSTLHAQGAATFGNHVSMTGSLTIGSDSDGTDRTVTFGHSTLKTIMGIDDSADAFVINTDASFDGTLANNSLTIDASHNVTVAGNVSGSGTLSCVGALTTAGTINPQSKGITNAGSIAGATSVDGTGDLTMATITMTGFSVDADGDTALKTLAVDDGSTIGCDSDTDLLTLSSNILQIKGAISGSNTLHNVGAATFGNTLATTGSITAGSHILPSTDNSYNLGSGAKRWANLYTGDLHLKNDRGDWTIIEEEDFLCVINNKTGKKYKMGMIPMEDDE
tara:strand:+ start:1893 stop:3809 length:1917 start_codon:yes stop_codon:yes gene_type:complete